MSTFKTLNGIDVNNNTKKKGKLTYLSWAWAWAELLKRYPDSKRIVYENAQTGLPYWKDNGGVIVKVGIVVGGVEHISHLACMDNRMNAIQPDKVTMRDVTDTIQRCTVKAIALHGLGLYIYAGEDLPEMPLLEPGTPVFDRAKIWIRTEGGSIEQARSKYTITKEVEDLLLK
jgi:hypothetical protein|tara:strand:- start:388 stop:906 length:519 start_codon:yes stop_codon:yes gene_type:complete